MKGRMGPLEQASSAALTSLASQLGLALPPLKKVRVRGDTVALTTAAGVTTGALTAPRTLLCELLRPTEPTLGLRLWRPTGLADDVAVALQGDGRAHDDWLALARVVLEAGEQEAAQLLWLAADSLLTCEDPGDFFPRWPRAARVAAGSFSSEASRVEKLLPLAKSRSPVEACLAAQTIAHDFAAALFDLAQRPVQPARAQRLRRSLAGLLPSLEARSEPAVREAAHLLRWRATFARDLHG